MIGLGRQLGAIARGHDGVLMASCRGKCRHWDAGWCNRAPGKQVLGPLLSFSGGPCCKTTMPLPRLHWPLFSGLGLFVVLACTLGNSWLFSWSGLFSSWMFSTVEQECVFTHSLTHSLRHTHHHHPATHPPTHHTHSDTLH